jgi:hypothetical protein
VSVLDGWTGVAGGVMGAVEGVESNTEVMAGLCVSAGIPELPGVHAPRNRKEMAKVILLGVIIIEIPCVFF